MNVIETVNWMQRNVHPEGTIRKWALDPEALPNGLPFMGGFVELFPDATLPPPADVQAAQAEYDTFVAATRTLATAQKAAEDAKSQLADLHPDIIAALTTAVLTGDKTTLLALQRQAAPLQEDVAAATAEVTAVATTLAALDPTADATAESA